jgi:hypothetical protein
VCVRACAKKCIGSSAVYDCDHHECQNVTFWISANVRVSFFKHKTLVVPLADTSTVSKLCPLIDTTCPSMILMQNNVTLGVPGPGLSVSATRQPGPHHHRTGLCQQQQQQQRMMCERFPVPQHPLSQQSRLAPLNVSVNFTPSHHTTPSQCILNTYILATTILGFPVKHLGVWDDKAGVWNCESILKRV